MTLPEEYLVKVPEGARNNLHEARPRDVSSLPLIVGLHAAASA